MEARHVGSIEAIPRFPNEMFKEICQYLPPLALAQCSGVSLYWHKELHKKTVETFRSSLTAVSTIIGLKPEKAYLFINTLLLQTGTLHRLHLRISDIWDLLLQEFTIFNFYCFSYGNEEMKGKKNYTLSALQVLITTSEPLDSVLRIFPTILFKTKIPEFMNDIANWDMEMKKKLSACIQTRRLQKIPGFIGENLESVPPRLKKLQPQLAAGMFPHPDLTLREALKISLHHAISTGEEPHPDEDKVKTLISYLHYKPGTIADIIHGWKYESIPTPHDSIPAKWIQWGLRLFDHSALPPTPLQTIVDKYETTSLRLQK